MSSIYSLYYKGAFSQSALVFPGDFKNRTTAAENTEAIYEIASKWRTITLSPLREVSSEPLLRGKYEGWTGRTVRLNGFGGETVAKRRGCMSLGWSFVDFMSNEFSWHVSTWSTSWTLTDAGGRVVAKFTRAGFKLSKMGVLEVMERVDEVLLALILISCRLVHQSVHESENNGGS
ncbi:hypothetical protein H4218_004428 [Coemansia sp. IMI 209128]|uniref:Uncharacterized protein n=1 Tax=Coemansia linderi TaxID=2663919 RepID=A0ACC1KLU0_9FUNG|nr:hypothetical protein GGI10_004397 [Coemansia sp. RSA 2530]KAJ2696697.1 hypothetical protein H4218_004428 [Coemansia sp. IMI 209128]KAJ2791717.1 hypothetical protein GGI18_000937 [Coemansia linderi]